MPLPIRIDATTLPALLFGGSLVVASGVMIFLLWRSRIAVKAASDTDDRTRVHAHRQFRRRTQISLMIGLIGLLIAIGDQLENVFRIRPLLFVVWVVVVLILVVWSVLMALGDWLSTMAFSAVARVELRQQRRELENEIARYHATKNGHTKNGSTPLNDGA